MHAYQKILFKINEQNIVYMELNLHPKNEESTCTCNCSDFKYSIASSSIEALSDYEFRIGMEVRNNNEEANKI